MTLDSMMSKAQPSLDLLREFDDGSSRRTTVIFQLDYIEISAAVKHGKNESGYIQVSVYPGAQKTLYYNIFRCVGSHNLIGQCPFWVFSTEKGAKGLKTGTR